MRKFGALVLALFLVTLVAVNSSDARDKSGDAGRLLTGRVVNRQDQPLPSAVVYLSNTRTRGLKTFIVGQDGVYRFPALSPNIDYEVYAQYNNRKSDTRTVSQFDNRSTVNIDLRIDTK